MKFDIEVLDNLFTPFRGSPEGIKEQIPINSNQWPSEWKRIEYKKYPRFKKFDLPDPGKQVKLVLDINAKQESLNNYFSGKVIDLYSLSRLLYWSCGEKKDKKSRSYFSFGNRFPVETYLFCFKGFSLVPEGVYHYAVQEHTLERINKITFSEKQLNRLFKYPWHKKASIAIVHTAIFERSTRKYNEIGFEYSFFETGSIVQNIQIYASTLGLKSYIAEDITKSYIEFLLNLDNKKENVTGVTLLG